jgi:hypothetical protein
MRSAAALRVLYHPCLWGKSAQLQHGEATARRGGGAPLARAGRPTANQHGWVPARQPAFREVECFHGVVQLFLHGLRDPFEAEVSLLSGCCAAGSGGPSSRQVLL